MRDPALAALLGLSALETDFGMEFGDEDDDDDIDEYGAEFGDEDDMGARLKLPGFRQLRPPSSQQLVANWQQRQARLMQARRRSAMLDPNRGSGLKVERYVFPLSQTITIGTAVALTLTGSPDCTFRPQRFTMVVPTAGFATITSIRMANVNVSIGPGTLDAFQFNSNGVGQSMDMPTLSPANRATINGNYTGFLGGFANGTSFIMSASFVGPSSLAGGAGI